MKRVLPFFMLLFLLLPGCVFPGPAGPSGEGPVATQSGIPAKPLPPAGTSTAGETPPVETPPPLAVWLEEPFSKEYTATDGTVIMTLTLRLPAMENPDGYAPWAAINNYYAGIAAELRRDADDQALWAADDYGMSQGSGFVFSPYFMKHDYRIAYEDERVVSIVRTGGTGVVDMEAENGTWAFAEQFDLTTGWRLRFADCFGGLSADAQALVLAKVKEAAAGTPWAGADAALERHFDPERFYLTEDAFVVFYNPGGLVAITGEPVEFPIPFDQLEGAWILW